MLIDWWVAGGGGGGGMVDENGKEMMVAAIEDVFDEDYVMGPNEERICGFCGTGDR